MTVAKRTRKPKTAATKKKAPARKAPRTQRKKAVAEAAAPVPEEALEPQVAFASPEVEFAARMTPPPPPRALPERRRGVFFDVENTSRAEDISRVLTYLDLDWGSRATEFCAVGNWRVIGHDTARLLARQGARLVHSAPAVGVRDWSDLRIAVAAGVWLASARPGDLIEVVSDDQAFDAVGDVAASLGVEFRRTSYRALAGLAKASRAEVAPAVEAKPHAPRRRGGRRRGRGGLSGSSGRSDAEQRSARPPVAPPPTISDEPDAEPGEEEVHTAPHDEIVEVMRDLMHASPDGVTLDALANELRSRGYQRPPGSPRLITRLRRIKQLDVGRTGMIRLLGETGALPAIEAEDLEGVDETTGEVEAGAEGAPDGAPRRRRRRGGRRRRGRRGPGTEAATGSDVEAAQTPMAAATVVSLD